MRNGTRGSIASALFAIGLWSAHAAPAERISLRHVSLDLPGPPSAVISADVNGDGRRDLTIVLAYTEWKSISVDRVKGMVEMIEVVPALFDRREARLYLAEADGSYREAAPALALPLSVLSVAAGPSSAPVVALTDEGVSALRVVAGERGPALVFDPLVADPPVVAGSRTFLPGLEFVRDGDGDGNLDLLLPAPDGIAFYRGDGSGFASTPAQRLAFPSDRRTSGRRPGRSYPVPRVQDVDGDGKIDLADVDLRAGPERVAVRLGLGDGRFKEARSIPLGCLGVGRVVKKPSKDKDEKGKPREETVGERSLAYFGDLDGDGRAEVVTRTPIPEEKSGMRADMREGTQPRSAYRFHRLREDLTPDPAPYHEAVIEGFAFDSTFGAVSWDEWRDLDADGRRDLVTLSLDLSMFQILRAMTTKRISVGLEFRVYAQDASGRFALAPGKRLDEKLKFDLNDVSFSRLAEFAGDFDGDRRVDFVHLGRGKQVTVHRGQAGCRYAEEPDLSLALVEEPQDVSLVEIRDFDGDGRADLKVTRAVGEEDEGATSPVRLDLYLSGGAP